MSGAGGRISARLEVGPHGEDALAVLGVKGREALSQPFRFEVDFCPLEDGPLEVAELIGQEACLRLEAQGAVRLFHGEVAQVSFLGRQGGRWRYRLVVEPRLAGLRHTQKSRIFQGLSVPEVVQRVLKEGGVEVRLALSGSHPAREYLVQYRESDFHFVSRLLEEVGACYFFEHAEDGHLLVLTDASQAWLRPPEVDCLPVRADWGGLQPEAHVTTLGRCEAVGPTRVAVRDFAPLTPLVDLSASSQAESGPSDLEVYEYPAGHGRPSDASGLAKLRLEALRVPTLTVEGHSTAAHLTAGCCFRVEGCADGTLDGAYVALEVQHRWGEAQEERVQVEGYGNTFLCLPEAVPFRPPRRTARPSIVGVQTATVVGPQGEEVHTDAHGRIKVQFHWDREGSRDDKASLWARVGQAWAGAGMGASVLPRVGQEVVVRFLEGNPDRPLVVGAVFHGAHPPALALPDNKTQSTFLSSSSPGDSGFNQLRFEDAAGEEEVFLHGQKDATLHTLNEKTQEVAGNASLQVTGKRTKQVTGAQRLQVGGDDAGEVGGSSTLLVSGARTTEVKGDHAEEVETAQSVTVASTRSVTVTGAAVESVGGAKAINVGAAHAVDVVLASNTLVGGAWAQEVGGLRHEAVGKYRSEVVGQDSSSTVKGGTKAEVGGSWTRAVGKDLKEEAGNHFITEVKEAAAFVSAKLVQKADEWAVVVGGELRLLINKSGTVKLFPKTLTVDGSSVALKGSKVKKDSGGGGGPSVAFQEVLDASVATVGKTFKPGDADPPLGSQDAAAFKDGVYTRRTLAKDVPAERLFGGGAFPVGKWVTAGGRPKGLEGKIRMALRPEWGNAASESKTLTMRVGTVLYEGVVAGQGGPYGGGATQLLILVPDDVVAKGGKVVGEWLVKNVFL